MVTDYPVPGDSVSNCLGNESSLSVAMSTFSIQIVHAQGDKPNSVRNIPCMFG